MKTIIIRRTIISTLLLLGLTNYALAAPALPISSQISEEAQEEKIEIVQEIKIEAQSSTSASNPKLKEGNACSDEDLEEVEGKLFTEIPMAQTVPCDKVDCTDLDAARMYNDNYIKLKTAKTTSCNK